MIQRTVQNKDISWCGLDCRYEVQHHASVKALADRQVGGPLVLQVTGGRDQSVPLKADASARIRFSSQAEGQASPQTGNNNIFHVERRAPGSVDALQIPETWLQVITLQLGLLTLTYALCMSLHGRLLHAIFSLKEER